MAKWRTGKKLGRTIYRDDEVVGMVDTPAIAAQLVDAANGRARKVEQTATHRAVQSLLFAMSIYRGHSITHRGPAGCLMTAIELLEPETAVRLADGCEPGDLMDREDG